MELVKSDSDGSCILLDCLGFCRAVFVAKKVSDHNSAFLSICLISCRRYFLHIQMEYSFGMANASRALYSRIYLLYDIGGGIGDLIFVLEKHNFNAKRGAIIKFF